MTGKTLVRVWTAAGYAVCVLALLALLVDAIGGVL